MTTPPLTPGQRQALRYASRKGGAYVGTGKNAPDKHVTKPVAKKLLALGYAVQHGDTLLTTKTGRKALLIPIPESPVYLRQRDGLTTRRELSVRDEPEVQDTADLRAYWRDDADARKSDTEDRRAQARRLARATRRAA